MGQSCQEFRETSTFTSRNQIAVVTGIMTLQKEFNKIVCPWLIGPGIKFKLWGLAASTFEPSPWFLNLSLTKTLDSFFLVHSVSLLKLLMI